MARTLDEIKQSIRADFVSNFAMQDAYGLDPEKSFDEQFSPASLEAIWTYIVASAIYLMELLFDAKVEEVDNQIAVTYPFSTAWYYDRALEFQLGDSLVFDESTYKFTYPVPDESKQIVKHVAIRQRQIEGVTKLQVYAAKQDKAALSSDELNAFTDYITELGAAGTHFQYISLPPDELEINMVVTYDPQVLDSEGNSLANGGKPVEDAIINYLDNIRYGGVFSRTRLVDAAQSASGVVDPQLGDVKMNTELNNSNAFESPSGFFKAQTLNLLYTPGYYDY